MTLQRAAAALTLLALLAGPAEARDWPEPGGGPRNHNSTARFEAPREAPIEKWRAKYDDVLGEPVVSKGVVYAAVRRKGSQRLVAIDAETGDRIAQVRFKAKSFAHVSVRGPMIVVVTSDKLFVFVKKDAELVLANEIKGSFRSPATLLPGAAAVFDTGKMKVIALRSGEALHETPAIAQKPVAVFGEDRSATLYFQAPVGADERLRVVAVRIEGLGAPDPTITMEDAVDHFVPFSKKQQPARLLLVNEGATPLFLAAGAHEVRTLDKSTSPFFFSPPSGGDPSIISDPVVWGGALYGRSGTGSLILQEPPDAGRPILTRQKRPHGARKGPITCARGVLLLGNFAMELESRRVLWVVPNLDSVGPMIPVADGVVVVEASDGDLVAYSDAPELIAAARAEAEARASAAEAAEEKAALAAQAKAARERNDRKKAARERASQAQNGGDVDPATTTKRPGGAPKIPRPERETVEVASANPDPEPAAKPKRKPKPRPERAAEREPSRAKPKARPKVDPEVDPEPEVEPRPKRQPKRQPKARAETRPERKPKTRPAVEPEPETQPDPNQAPKPKSSNPFDEPFEFATSSDRKPKRTDKARSKTQLKTQPKTQPKARPSAEPREPSRTSSKPKARPKPKAAPKPAGPVVPATMPGSGAAVVLVDGTRLPGQVRRLDNGGVAIKSLSGEVSRYPLRRVSAIESDGGVEVVGEPYGLVLAAQAAIDRGLREDLADVVQSYVRRSLVSEARRLLLEVRRRGHDEDHIRDLEEQLVNKKELDVGTRASELATANGEEAAARKAALDRTLEAVQWLSDASLDLEASAILANAARIWPAQFVPENPQTRIHRVAEGLVPAEFPWADKDDAAVRWLAWAPHLAPSSARFATEAERPDLGPTGSTWQRRTYVLRTENLVVVTKSSDPLVLGPTLGAGEATVRALDVLLANPPRGDEAPLEVRIHRSRDAYLREDLGGGRKAEERSMGAYTPSLRTTRLHVPTNGGQTDGGRGLADVFARELTHQYIAERWRAIDGADGPDAEAPGFWVRVGFARFVEDQTIELHRPGLRIDDPSAQSVEAATALDAKRRLMGMDVFLDASLSKVLRMPDRGITTVGVGPDEIPIQYSRRSIYEDQAGALVFFLLHGSGPEGRRGFMKLLLGHHRGETTVAPWTELGYETAADLEQAFLAYLETVTAEE